MKGNAFGHIVLTNIGPLGLEQAFAPIPCATHCEMCVCQGKVTKKPVVIDDKIVIRDIMSCVYTIDHRYGDAALFCTFGKIMKDCLENPEEFNPNNYQELPQYAELAKRRKQE